MARQIYQNKDYTCKFDLKRKVLKTILLNFTSVANQMLEAAVTGTVPDVGPPNTLEQEVALRPMCVQLKVRLPK